MNEEIKLKFGKHNGKMLKDVPNEYLQWLLKNDILRGRAMLYAKQKTNHPKSKYQITVEDSLNGDGVYVVEAHNKKDAWNVCKRNNNIRCTQSFYGTSYSVVKL